MVYKSCLTILISAVMFYGIYGTGSLYAQESFNRSIIGTVINITNNTNPTGAAVPQSHSGINWLSMCRNPIVDTVIAQPCESLTSPDGYSLTPLGQRVVACVLGGGVLLAYDPSGATFAEAQGIAKTTGICG